MKPDAPVFFFRDPARIPRIFDPGIPRDPEIFASRDPGRDPKNFFAGRDPVSASYFKIKLMSSFVPFI